ncbi:hypothetical protein DFJ73DRAFT_867860 [Zopfochytrium polystomum]|nr:hypothetical protein DFJ73DRAFT_867860 [Zopfochytrium polystomum]
MCYIKPTLLAQPLQNAAFFAAHAGNGGSTSDNNLLLRNVSNGLAFNHAVESLAVQSQQQKRQRPVGLASGSSTHQNNSSCDHWYSQQGPVAGPSSSRSLFVDFPDLQDSLADEDWFNEGCDGFLAPASLAAGTGPTPQFGQLDFDSATFSLLGPDFATQEPASAIANGAELVPWLDSLTASAIDDIGPATVQPALLGGRVSARGSSAIAGEADDSALIKAEEDAASALAQAPPSFLPSPQQSVTSSKDSVSPDLSGNASKKKRDSCKTAISARAAVVSQPESAQPAKRKSDSHDDEEEEVLIKRAKNTEAARRSRARKNARVESLEAEVAQLEQDKASLLVRLAVIESERKNSAQRESDLTKRVTQLEAQLTETHRAMVLGLGVKTRV